MDGFPDDLDVISLSDYADDQDNDDSIPYARSFLTFIDKAVTAFHAVSIARHELHQNGFVEIREAEDWSTHLERNGKYYLSRNNSSLIAFAIGGHFSTSPSSDSAFSLIATHIDSIHLKLKPHSLLPSRVNIERAGVAPYSGGGKAQRWDAEFSTWWNRELGIGGRVMVKDKNGTVDQRLWKSDGPVAFIPHAGKENDKGPFNYETQMVPIVGLLPIPIPTSEYSDIPLSAHHSTRLLNYIASSLSIDPSDIIDFDLQLYSTEPSTLLGLSSPPSFISAPRMDDKLCSFAAYKALLNVTSSDLEKSKDIMCVFMSDNEEVGSSLRQGARGTFLESVLKRVAEVFCVRDQNQKGRREEGCANNNAITPLLARSLLISADVANGINPSFISDDVYDEELKMIPTYNKGVVVSFDRGGSMSTDCWGAEVAKRVGVEVGVGVQLYQSRSDTGGGGTIGPMLSQRLGMKAVEIGIPMTSMHSIRAITGSQDPGIGVRFFEGCLKRWEALRVNFGEWD